MIVPVQDVRASDYDMKISVSILLGIRTFII